jgi:hypothetical protein
VHVTKVAEATSGSSQVIDNTEDSSIKMNFGGLYHFKVMRQYWEFPPL